MIRLEDVTVGFAGEPLVEGADVHVRPGDRIGLVGRNGTGKTTLLRVLAGDLSPDLGRRHVRGGVTLGWLPQHGVSLSDDTVWNEARSGMVRMRALAERLDAAEAAVAADVPGAAERLGDATEVFRLAGGYAQEEVIGEVLHGLGFGAEDWHRPCATFSGGWQMRIALARLLLSEPDVALLDEPTNHLDLPTRSWLAGYLSRWKAALVVVSHDRYLLERVPTRILEVRGKRVHTYTGRFSQFLTERASRLSAETTAFARQQDEIAKLERFVNRFRYQANKAAQAQSRQKRLDKMDRLVPPGGLEDAPRLRLPEAQGSSTELVMLRKAVIGYDDGPPVLDSIDFTVERGMRIALVGPNGGGKSTLLHALVGTLRPSAGRRVVGDGVRIGVYDQDVAASLPDTATPLEHLVSRAPRISPTRLRGILGALGLSGDDALRPISDLSGGEKARVALAALTVRPHNLLLLDEPTNHLDAESVDALVEALSDFAGGLVFVSHDRFVVEGLATHVAKVRDGKVVVREGVFAEDLDVTPLTRSASAETDDDAAPPTETYEERKRRQRERERAERRSAALLAEIETLEARGAEIEEEMFSAAEDYSRLHTLEEERRQLQEVLDRRFAEWEEADAAIATALALDASRA